MVIARLGLIFALVYRKNQFRELCYFQYTLNDIKSKCKLFADNTSLFPVVHHIDISANDLNHDLVKISEWAFQWKKKFNPDTTKQAQETIFSKKNLFLSIPTLCRSSF